MSLCVYFVCEAMEFWCVYFEEKNYDFCLCYFLFFEIFCDSLLKNDLLENNRIDREKENQLNSIKY